MKYLIYSTSKSPWYQEQANQAAFYLSQSKGRGKVEIDVVYERAPRRVETTVDEKGDRRLSWDWFKQKFPKRGYDGVGFHFTDYYKNKWRLSVRGSKNTHNKQYPEFFFACGTEEAKGYDLISNFTRLLVHEISHFDEDLDDAYDNALPQESVHTWDYEFKAIHHYPRFVDYRAYNLKRKVNNVINQVIDFINNVLKP